MSHKVKMNRRKIEFPRFKINVLTCEKVCIPFIVVVVILIILALIHILSEATTNMTFKEHGRINVLMAFTGKTMSGICYALETVGLCW